MEKRQLRNSKSNTDEWIKCQSKQRPGQYYMFNMATGETKWCSEFKEDAPLNKSNDTKKPTSPPKTINAKSIRTPAQDRLKRLQHDLKKEHKEKLTQKQSQNTRRQRNQKQVVTTSKENKSVGVKDTNNKTPKAKSTTIITPTDSRKDCQPSTSKDALLLNKETDKRPTNSSTQINTTINKSKEKSSKTQTKKRTSAEATVEKTMKRKKPSNQDLPLKEKDSPNTEDEKNEATSHKQTAVVSGIGSGIVNKIKAICKSTFNSYCNAKNALSQKPLKPCIKPNSFKIPKKPSGAQNSANFTVQIREPDEDGSESDISNNSNDITNAPVTIVMKGTATPSNGDATVDFKAIALTTVPSQLYASPNRALPAYPQGSANSRLERLRNSLTQQAFPNGHNSSTPTRLCASACSSALACVLRDTTMADESTENIDEPMDWMPSEEMKTETIELSSNESSNQQAETMGEYYGTVNENLLRYAVEQKIGAAGTIGRWLNDYYYFVLDTNVLLQHLAFLEELCQMKLCDTGGTILYIPYSVLQELDKLKQFAVGDGTKVLAVRAIKYLNSKFETKNKHLQAQSALSELEHLVEITSPDDRIINCCLQVKQQIDHVILLTEDINLRNKAICNNILVSTKSDLVAKHK
ncbi:PREDICTED: probable replication factor C subunit 1 [Bactrocera latifrons]|uniref:probable replication factor C subunit 1 n=1 Tax=Bactrocera latifrons TaxID=174628 RepID=UPI0008DD324E|nr:PREDICTED: probable replication factor C subunit 1 [Bactrocera latifrons]